MCKNVTGIKHIFFKFMCQLHPLHPLQILNIESLDTFLIVTDYIIFNVTYVTINLSRGARRHSGKTPSFTEGMKAEPRRLVNITFLNYHF